MKHHELSVFAADSSFTLDIEGVYKSENKLIVLANLKESPGVSLCCTTWFSVGVEIDASEDSQVECYLIGDCPAEEKMKKNYIPITKEEADKLVHELNPVAFTQTKLKSDELKFVIEYNKFEDKKRNTYDQIMRFLQLQAEERQAEFKKQGKEIEPIDSWQLRFGHSPKVSRRIDELAEKNLLDNQDELQKLVDECMPDINKLIRAKLSFMERAEKFTGVNRHGLYAAAVTGVVSVAAVGLTVMSKTRP